VLEYTVTACDTLNLPAFSTSEGLIALPSIWFQSVSGTPNGLPVPYTYHAKSPFPGPILTKPAFVGYIVYVATGILTVLVVPAAEKLLIATETFIYGSIICPIIKWHEYQGFHHICQ